MKYFLLIAFSITATIAHSQTLKKYAISNSGCSLYNYCESKYEMSLSDDSSKVYTGECAAGDVTYGVVCVKLLTPVPDSIMAEDLLIAYLEYLKSSFSITKAAGYGKGHVSPSDKKLHGIIDYWEDAELDKWKIKAWTDGRYIGFMYTYSKKELPETKVNVYLDSFKVPEK